MRVITVFFTPDTVFRRSGADHFIAERRRRGRPRVYGENSQLATRCECRIKLPRKLDLRVLRRHGQPLSDAGFSADIRTGKRQQSPGCRIRMRCDLYKPALTPKLHEQIRNKINRQEVSVSARPVAPGLRSRRTCHSPGRRCCISRLRRLFLPCEDRFFLAMRTSSRGLRLSIRSGIGDLTRFSSRSRLWSSLAVLSN